MTMTERALNRKLAAWWVLVGGLSLIAFLSAAAAPEERQRDLVYGYEFGVGSIVTYGLILGIVLVIARGLDFREVFALRRPTSWKAAGAVAVLMLIAVFVVAGILEALLHAGEEQGLDPTGWRPDRAGALALSAIGIAVAAPIAEELTFRGLGFFLLNQFGHWVAIVVTALAFALVHGIVVGIPVFFVIGAGLAYLRHRTNSIVPAVLVHAAFNGTQLAVGVLA